MKIKAKTHKGMKKRVRVTGSGKITRDKRRARNSRINRMQNKATNTDTKQLILSKDATRKAKRLLNI